MSAAYVVYRLRSDGAATPASHVALVHSARRSARIDRAVGRTLRRLQGLDAVRSLGYVTFADYVREHLGQSPRWAEACIRLDRIAERCPAVGTAHASGVLTSSHLLVLGGVVDATNEEAWIACARDHSVRDLRKLVAEARNDPGRWPPGSENIDEISALDDAIELERAKKEARGLLDDEDGDGKEEDSGDAENDSGDAEDDSGAAEDDSSDTEGGDGKDEPGGAEKLPRPADERSAPNGEATGPALPLPATGGRRRRLAPGMEDRDGERWIRLEVRIPAPVASLLDYTIDVARRVGGRQAPVLTCVEQFLAEYASRHGVTVDASGLSDEAVRGRYLDQASTPWRGLPDADRPLSAETALHERRDLRVAAEIAPFDPVIDAVPPPRAAALDAHLRELMRLRREAHACFSERLSACRSYHQWRELGFVSMAHYCREALGVSVRLVQELCRVHASFRPMPELERAYRAGEISWSKLRLIVDVCSHQNVNAWIARAKRVTCRYLEREVRCARHRIEAGRLPRHAYPEPRPLQFVPPYAESSLVRPGVELWEEGEGTATAHTSALGERTAAESSDAHTSAPGERISAVSGDAHTSAPGAGAALDPGCAYASSDPDGGPQPKPDLPCRFRLWMPQSLHRFWCDVDLSITLSLGRPSYPWERLLVLLRHFLDQWDAGGYETWRKSAQLHLRFGCMCAVPGCTQRRNLHGHHLEHLSQGGSNAPENLSSVCAGHHLGGIHAAIIRVHGRAPDALEWHLPGGLHTIGDVIVDGGGNQNRSVPKPADGKEVN
jgi:hypothetical protein